jgi:hypothetical protein
MLIPFHKKYCFNSESEIRQEAFQGRRTELQLADASIYPLNFGWFLLNFSLNLYLCHANIFYIAAIVIAKTKDDTYNPLRIM